MAKPHSIADLDGAAAHLRDLIGNLEEAVASPSMDPVRRAELALHIDALKEGQGVLEREVAVLGMPQGGEVATTDVHEDLRNAFDHLVEQVDNLDETVGGPEVSPATRGVLGFHLDAIREALTVLERESGRVGRAQADAIIEATVLAAQLEEAQRSTERACQEAKDAHALLEEFLASMSHELRTPLHGILSFARLGASKLRAGTLDPDKHAQYLGRIEECGTILLGLVDDLLDLSRLQKSSVQLRLETVDLRGVIEGVIAEFESIGEQRDLSVELREFDDHDVRIDVSRMQQVLRNLLSNAVRFAPDDSRITIAVEQDSAFTTVRCRDRGPGVPEEELNRVFERFVGSPGGARGAANPGGAKLEGIGLGLSISRELVLAHGGSIRVENHPMGGAVFAFSFPTDGPRAPNAAFSGGTSGD